jgi:c-type cytochrome biogenesis protein CcmF
MTLGFYFLLDSFYFCCIYVVLYSFLKLFNINRNYFYYLLLFIFIFIFFSFINFLYLHIISDFTFLVVAKSSNIFESVFYKITGAWSNHEGSILLWILLLIIYTFLNASSLKTYYFFFQIYLNIYQVGLLLYLLLFIIFSTNPFLFTRVFVLNGLQLNPLLQDFTLSIHPPILYLGYLGYTLIFSSILLYFRLNRFSFTFFSNIKSYLYITLAFLTLGILLGSWWAYYELGWGGWWFWDPVENISLFPWILSVIFLHLSHFVFKKHGGTLYVLFIGLLLFLIILFGVFFVRSGLLMSVHTFALDTSRGFLLLILLLLLIFCSILHFYLLKCSGYFYFNFFSGQKVSWQYLLYFFNLILFCLLLFLWFLGTFMPTIFKIFFENTFILGVQYFNESSITLVWGSLILLISFLIYSLQSAIVLFLMNLFWFGILIDFLTFSYDLYIFLLLHLLFMLFLVGFLRKDFLSFNILIHILVVFFIFCILIFSYNSLEYFNVFRPGDSLYFLQLFLVFRGVTLINNYNYFTIFGNFVLTDWFHLKYLGLLFPEKRFYFIEKFAGIKAHIISNYFTDLYIVIGEGHILSGWFIHLMYNPGMPFIWVFGFCFVLLFLYKGLVFRSQLFLNFSFKRLW